MPILLWALLAAAVISGARPLCAQERIAGRAQIPVVVVSGSTRPEFRAARDRSTPPAPLSAAEKAEMFNVALSLGAAQIPGVGTGIRLTPSQPFLANQGRLDFSAARMVLTDNEGGEARMLAPSESPEGRGSSAVCSFRPTLVDQPLLVDASIWFDAGSQPGKKGKIRLWSPGGPLDQTLELATGSHHLVAIYKPADLQEKSIFVSLRKEDGNARFTFYACEVTPLN